jgi:hypothetical protein
VTVPNVSPAREAPGRHDPLFTNLADGTLKQLSQTQIRKKYSWSSAPRSSLGTGDLDGAQGCAPIHSQIGAKNALLKSGGNGRSRLRSHQTGVEYCGLVPNSIEGHRPSGPDGPAQARPPHHRLRSGTLPAW